MRDHSLLKQTVTLLALLFVVPIAQAKRTRLTWVNGIAHSMEHMEEGKADIVKYFGGKTVEFCYNPTAMSHNDDLIGYAADLTQAGTQKFGRITGEVNTLVQHLKKAVKQVGTRGIVIHIAHSQGALLTHLATKQLTPMEMSQIEVIAFGGAAALRKTPATPFARVVNYYAINDPLLLVVPPAAQALSSGLVGDEEFCFLAPRIGDPIGDHDLFGPTYAQALTWEGKRFQTEYQSIVHRATRPVILLYIAILQALYDKLRVAIKMLLVRPIVYLLVGPLAGVRLLIKKYAIRPAVHIVFFIFLLVRELFRPIWRQDEHYQPMQVAVELAASAKNTTKALIFT